VRPGYPPELLEFLRARFVLGRGKTVIELGAGTGKLTRLLASTGARIVAIEPVAAMRDQIAKLLPEVPLMGGVAESIPIAGRTADVVVAAQAFHWFSNRAALEEIHRVLRPAGHLVVMWNILDQRPDWAARLAAIMDNPRGNAPSFKTTGWQRVFDGYDKFSPIEHRVFQHVHKCTPEMLQARVASISYVAVLPATEREAILQEVRELLARPPLKGLRTLELPYSAHVYWAQAK